MRVDDFHHVGDGDVVITRNLSGRQLGGLAHWDVMGTNCDEVSV